MRKIKGTILAAEPLTDRIKALRICAAEGAVLPDYTPGSHVEFDLPDGGTRAYSLISFDAKFDNPDHYLVAVQLEGEGQGGSKFMHTLGVGDAISFTGPKNDFPLNIDVPAVLLAGGIGITPMISMASALVAAQQDVKLIFAGRTEADMAYRTALQNALGERVTLHFDALSGVINLDAIISDLESADLYVCGPRQMIDAVRTKAEAAGIASGRIHFELFSAPTPSGEDTPFEVQINDGTVFTIPAGRSIIDVLEENDVDVMYDCQRGDCGICQCDVLEGVPDHRDVVLTQAERDAGDVMQICVSRAKTPRLVLDI